MSHINNRRLAVLLAALLVSGLLVAPVAVGATEDDQHGTTEDDRHTTPNTAANATDDSEAERTKANRRTVNVNGGDGSNDTVAMAGPSIDVTVYPNGTIVITIVLWDDDDGAADGGDGEPNDRALNLRFDGNGELMGESAARPEFDDLTMTRGAKQGEKMLHGDGDDANSAATKRAKKKDKHTQRATTEGKKHDKSAARLRP